MMFSARHSSARSAFASARVDYPALIVLMLLFSVSSASASASDAMTGIVNYVLDGDTVNLVNSRGEYRVRLAGIDAPEIAHGDDEVGQAFGMESKAALERMIEGKRVTVRVHTVGQRYGRLIGTVLYNGHDINLDLVRGGYAWEYDDYNTRRDLRVAERTAMRDRRGLWAGSNPVPPWQFRHQGPKGRGPQAGKQTPTHSLAEAFSKGSLDEAVGQTVDAVGATVEAADALLNRLWGGQ